MASNLIISKRFYNEIENVATKSTNGIHGTSETVTQLAEFIRNVYRFLSSLKNVDQDSVAVFHVDNGMGYDTNIINPRIGIGIIYFRYAEGNNSTISVDNINVDLTNYNLLIESTDIIRQIIRESLQRQKQQMQNTNGIINLYQSTTIDKLERMKASPMFSAEYFGAAGGNLHTRAVYANLDIQQTAKLNYGNVIVHLEFHATWDKILCINKYVSRKYCGGKSIIEQLQNFPELYSLVMKDHYLVDKLKRSYESGDGESMTIVALCDYLGSIKKEQMYANNDDIRSIAHKSSGKVERQDFSHAILTEFGVEGFVYYGSFDGMCCIPLNADKVIPTEYAISPQSPANLRTLRWQAFNTQYDAGQVNHIQAFMSKFGNEYLWDRNERSYLNTILVKKRSDNLFYYLDTVSGESVFPTGFYDARPFDPTFKRAWVQISEDSRPMYIDKAGNLYRTVRGRQVSNLSLWMWNDDINYDDEDYNNNGFTYLPGELD